MQMVSFYAQTEHFGIHLHRVDGKPFAALSVIDAWDCGMDGCLAGKIDNREDLTKLIDDLRAELDDIRDEVRKAKYYECSPFAALPAEPEPSQPAAADSSPEVGARDEDEEEEES